MEWIALPEAWIALATLTALEIVLGIDNIIFISILAGKLPPAQRPLAWRTGLLLAMGTRLALLGAISWIVKLTTPLFTVIGHAVSGKDLILILGGVFLLAKATREIHHRLEGPEHAQGKARSVTFAAVIAQIAVMDAVFSLDSVITAVGMADHIAVMVIAVVLSIGVMLISANAVSRFVNEHPTVKMLALSFLILIGAMLLAEGIGHHGINKGYIYFAMGFSIFVELLNMRTRRAPIRLRESPLRPAEDTETQAASGA